MPAAHVYRPIRNGDIQTEVVEHTAVGSQKHLIAWIRQESLSVLPGQAGEPINTRCFECDERSLPIWHDADLHAIQIRLARLPVIRVAPHRRVATRDPLVKPEWSSADK